MPREDLTEIADLMSGLARRVRQRTVERLDVPGMTPGRLRVLRSIAVAGPVRMGELASTLGVAPRSITSMVDDLVGFGLVSRVPDPEDRRATLVELTRAGRDLLVKAERSRTLVLEEMFSSLSTRQIEELRKLLGAASD